MTSSCLSSLTHINHLCLFLRPWVLNFPADRTKTGRCLNTESCKGHGGIHAHGRGHQRRQGTARRAARAGRVCSHLPAPGTLHPPISADSMLPRVHGQTRRELKIPHARPWAQNKHQNFLPDCFRNKGPLDFSVVSVISSKNSGVNINLSIRRASPC